MTPMTPTATMADQRSALRRAVLRRRAAVDPSTRVAFSAALLDALTSDPRLRAASDVGIYDAMASEAPTRQAMAALWARGTSVYLPQVRGKVMRFVRVRPDDALQTHALGMRQPSGTWLVRLLELDVLLMPLAGFDLTGQRLGLGGGFYDRAVATRRHRRAWRRPWLIGLAFETQRLDAVPAMRHDVPLDAVITENGITQFTGSAPPPDPNKDLAWPTG